MKIEINLTKRQILKITLENKEPLLTKKINKFLQRKSKKNCLYCLNDIDEIVQADTTINGISLCEVHAKMELEK